MLSARVARNQRSRESKVFAPLEPWTAANFGPFHTLALTTKFGWLVSCSRRPERKATTNWPREPKKNELEARPSPFPRSIDLIRMKEAVGSTKYLAHLPLLRELRDQGPR
jgi:hypothetical protein